ncbi:MAG TPA: hypothetical protein VNM14_04130 [Planctomycetota bacterium]|nr:hypothetical protein [Planctomycetota bacterium]
MLNSKSRIPLLIAGALVVLLLSAVLKWRTGLPTGRPQESARAVPLRISHLSEEVDARPHLLDRIRTATPAQGWAGPFDPPSGTIAERPSSPELKNVPAEALESLVTDLENELREKGGVYAYNSRHYGATLEAGWVDLATNHAIPDLGSPQLSYALEKITVGEAVIAKGGEAAGTPRPDRRTVVYRRGSVDEEYTLRADAMEQSFVVRELPAGRGAITVTGVVASNLTPPADGTRGSTLGFAYQGTEMITLSQAVAVDGAGRRLPLDLCWSDGRLSMTVPAEWVAGATLPILIDPLVGPSFSVYSSSSPNTIFTVNGYPVRMCDAAFSPLNQTWLVVWSERFGTGGMNGFDYDVRARRITASGAPTGSTISVAASSAGEYEPAISYSTGSASVNRYLIVWRHDPSNNLSDSDQYIRGKLYDADGVASFISPRPNPFDLENPIGQDFAPGAAYSPTNDRWYVSYTNKASSSDYNVRGRFVLSTGALDVSSNPDMDADVAARSSVAFENGVYLVAWEKGTSAARSAVARVMLADGSFPAAGATEVESSANAPRELDVAGGGGTFLLVWRNSTTQEVKGRIAAASAGPSVSFSTPALALSSGSVARATPRAAYSVSASAFYAVYSEGSVGDLFGVRVTPAGAVFPPEQLTASPADDQRVELAWNSLTNEMLIVSAIVTPGSFEVRGQRFSMGAPPPAAPTGLTATAGVAQVSLAWSASAGATSYNVKRATTSAGPYTLISSGPGLSYVDTGLTPGVPYFYVVSALSADGEGGNSTEVMSVPLPPPPAAPAALSAVPGNQQVSLSWSASSGATGYTLKRSNSTGGPYTTVGSSSGLSLLDPGLANGTTYFYVVTAFNSGGESANSGEVSATPLPPPAAPTNLTVTLSAGSAQLQWTGSAGAATYTVRRATAPGGPFTVLASGIGGTTYTDSSVVMGTTYYYTVSASNTAGESAPSAAGSVTPGFAPVAVFIADKNTPGVPELFVADEAGTTVVNLSGPLVPGGQVFKSLNPFSPDGTKVAFIAEKDTLGVRELYIVPSTGGTATKVSAPLASGGNVLEFKWSPDNARVGYSATDSGGLLELYGALADGSGSVKLSGTMASGSVGLGQFAWAPDGSRVAYSAYQDSASALELYTSMRDGTGNLKVSGLLTAGGTVSEFSWTRSGSRLLYQASQDAPGLFELFTVLPDGTGTVKISGTIAPGGAVQSFQPR